MVTSKREFKFGERMVTLETGRIARQATAAVMASIGDTMVLCTVVASKKENIGQSFLPLTVNYQEKAYAVGRIPGGFFRREGRPSESETIISRLIDRPIRPMFPKGFINDVQIVCTVMSANPNILPDIPAMLGASAALSLSGMPINGVMAGSRVGFINGEYVLNPDQDKLLDSSLDMILASTENAVLMVESNADELTEEQMLEALLFGHRENQTAIAEIKALVEEAGKPVWKFTPPTVDQGLEASIHEHYSASVRDAYLLTDKQKRQDAIAQIHADAVASLAGDDNDVDEKTVKTLLNALERDLVRTRILNDEPRIDGRNTKEVRPISIEVGVLPGAHGSVLFTRGETQAIVTTTLGGPRDGAIIESLSKTYKERFMLHYNFPPYSVGETGMIGSPKRREIGHGRLAKRSVVGLLPDEQKFPYTIRVVSEITESNGSSSMASVCGASLSLMDAGVPIKGAVAGIAMGLVKQGEKFAILTDILGDEDHLGDMDFKVAGTINGITALQMDIKVDGLSREIMEKALSQACEARQHILAKMAGVLSEPRDKVVSGAPVLKNIEIPREKIRKIIGKGGSTIRSITEETGTSIDVDDSGLISISSDSLEGVDAAIKRIEELVFSAEVEIGKAYDGTVKSIMDYGAFVEVLPGRDGLLHISQVAEGKIERVSDYLAVGDVIKVEVVSIDNRNRIKLFRKND